LSIENNKNEEIVESEYERNSSYSSGVTALLNKNLLISSNEMLQEIPEEEIEDGKGERRKQG